MKCAAFLAVSLAFAPSALAQTAAPRCADYQRMIDAAATRFVEYRGEAIRPTLFAATKTFRDAGSCMITDNAVVGFMCITLFKQEYAARIEQGAQLLDLRRCLVGWIEKPMTDVHHEIVESLGGQLFTRTRPEGDLAVGTTFGRGREDGQYVVGISFILNPPRKPGA